MAVELVCDQCGTVTATPGTDERVRCEQCGTLLRYGSESAFRPEYGTKRRGADRPAKTKPAFELAPLDTTVPVDESDTPPRAPTPTADTVSLAPLAERPEASAPAPIRTAPAPEPADELITPAPKAKTAFVPAGGEPAPKKRRAASAAPAADGSATPKKMKRKRLRTAPEEPADVVGADIDWDAPGWWSAWLDPVALMWLCVLMPVFTVAVIALSIGGALMGMVTASGIGGLGIPFVLAGLFLMTVPGGYVFGHLMSILSTWSEGEKVDPHWEPFDFREALGNLGWGLVAVVWTVVALLPVAGLVAVSDWVALWLASREGGLLVGFAACVYCSIGFLAAVKFQDSLAGNPLLVLGAIFRAQTGVIAYAVELLVHLALVAGAWILCWRIWGVSALFGIPALAIWWGVLILSASRLMRRLGMVYARNAKRLGWFR